MKKCLLVVLFVVMLAVDASAQAISAFWVNNGEDKVVKDELRLSRGVDVTNSIWDGRTVRLFAARNEMVNFNVVIESAFDEARNVSVSMGELLSENGGRIASRKAEGDEVFDYRSRNIELFYVRYLQLIGLSQLAYTPTYDERHVPHKLQLPYTMPKGRSKGEFKDRPNANKFYPDIAVPIEAVGSFSIPKGENQSVWVDIYVPRDAEPGMYQGRLTVLERGSLPTEVPVELEVLPLVLSDEFHAKTMVWYNEPDINQRYTGKRWWSGGSVTPEIREDMRTVLNRHFQMAKRHRIHLIGDGLDLLYKGAAVRPGEVYTGELFTSEHGYDGPGSGNPVDVYSVGTYGAWGAVKRIWDRSRRTSMWEKSDMVVNYFEEHYPNLEYFLYLMDEPHGEKKFAVVEQWAQWIKENPGPGHRLRTFCTTSLPSQQQYMPSVDIVLEGWGPRDVYKNALAKMRTSSTKVMGSNGWRPSTGTFMIEDDGVALRVNGWIQFKHKLDRWFYWASTNYRNPSRLKYETNVFQEARTFGRKKEGVHSKFGEWGNGYGNGDGLLFYPGKDTMFTEDSYGMLGPIASLRLKLWRRGLQDYEYLQMAHEVDPQAVEALVKNMVPESLWELGVTDRDDPTYIHKGISWSVNPDDWEHARRKLAEIIMGAPSTSRKDNQ